MDAGAGQDARDSQPGPCIPPGRTIRVPFDAARRALLGPERAARLDRRAALALEDALRSRPDGASDLDVLDALGRAGLETSAVLALLDEARERGAIQLRHGRWFLVEAVP